MDTQRADSGLVAIGARFGAAAAVGLGPGAAAALDTLGPAPAGGLRVRQVPLYATEFSGSGTFTQPATLGPPPGWYWSVRLLSATGFTAGSVAVAKNSPAGELLAVFAAPASGPVPPQAFNRGALLLHPGDYLVITGASITGTVQVQGQADAFEVPYLAEYLS